MEKRNHNTISSPCGRALMIKVIFAVICLFGTIIPSKAGLIKDGSHWWGGGWYMTAGVDGNQTSLFGFGYGTEVRIQLCDGQYPGQFAVFGNMAYIFRTSDGSSGYFLKTDKEEAIILCNAEGKAVWSFRRVDGSYEDVVEDMNKNLYSPIFLSGRIMTEIMDPYVLGRFSKDDLYLMRNEIYARRGHTFKTKRLQDLFSSKPWYTPTDSEFEPTLAPLEQVNMELIKNEESLPQGDRLSGKPIELQYPEVNVPLFPDIPADFFPSDFEALTKRRFEKQIPVAGGGERPSIIAFVNAFNQVWPTDPATNLLLEISDAYKSMKRKEENHYTTILDIPLGYAATECETGELPDFAATYWRRTNGHTLFAIQFWPRDNVRPFVCFFDYDPKTETMTPERGPSDTFVPTLKIDYIGYELPHFGKTFTLFEADTENDLRRTHYYEFDGMNLILSRTE